MSLHVPCPSCGADVVFRSPALPARVCDYCRTLLVRTDAGIAEQGHSAALPFDVSPVRIGMRGRADDRGFEVIGRVRWSWTDGAWNEWLLLFDDGGSAWLGEAMGQFMLLWERPFEPGRAAALDAVAAGRAATPGTKVRLGQAMMTIVDAREVLCVASEGELPFAAAPAWRLYSVDLRGPAGECACLQRDTRGVSYYEGRYVELAALAPQGMRVIEGWGMPDYGR